MFEVLVTWLSEALQAEITRMTIAFMLAARLHRTWVKNDMNEQFGRVTAAIDKVSTALTTRVESVEKRISILEGGKAKK